MLSYNTKQFLKKALIYLLIITVLIVFALEGSLGIFPFGAIICIAITAIFGLIAGVLHGKYWLFPNLLRTSRRVLFVGLAVLIPSYVIYRVQINNNFTSAAILVKAITAYQKQHKDYPPNLKVLVPQFLGKVPSVQVGVFPRKFDYEYIAPVSILNSENVSDLSEPAYYIEYPGYLGVRYEFLSRNERWMLDD